MTSPSDSILFLYTQDSGSWSQFMSDRLATPDYDISTCCKELPVTFPSSAPENTETDYANDVDSEEAIYTNTDVENVSINQNRDDVQCRNDKVNQTMEEKSDVFHYSEEIENSKACVVFISPEFLESTPPPRLDVNKLKCHKTVLVVLGVEIQDVPKAFPSFYKDVHRCKMCVVDGTEETIQECLALVIEAFESPCVSEQDEETEYMTPPPPVQRNKMEKILPGVLTETDREVHVLVLEIPEDEVTLVLDDYPHADIPLTCVTERLYSFVLPKDITGDVYFQFECQDHRFGDGVIHAPKKVDRLKQLLLEDDDPPSLLAMALGIPASNRALVNLLAECDAYSKSPKGSRRDASPIPPPCPPPRACSGSTISSTEDYIPMGPPIQKIDLLDAFAPSITVETRSGQHGSSRTPGRSQSDRIVDRTRPVLTPQPTEHGYDSGIANTDVLFQEPEPITEGGKKRVLEKIFGESADDIRRSMMFAKEYSASTPPGNSFAQLDVSDKSDGISLSSHGDPDDTSITSGSQRGSKKKTGLFSRFRNIKEAASKSTNRNRSESLPNAISSKLVFTKTYKKQDILNPERDSGSFSSNDEEDQDHQRVQKRTTRVFKPNKKNMRRRLSKRVEKALVEKIENAPHVPKRETFTSFL